MRRLLLFTDEPSSTFFAEAAAAANAEWDAVAAAAERQATASAFDPDGRDDDDEDDEASALLPSGPPATILPNRCSQRTACGTEADLPRHLWLCGSGPLCASAPARISPARMCGSPRVL